MATINVLDAADAIVALEKPNANGRVAAAASRPVVLSTEDKAVIDAISAFLAGTLRVKTAIPTSLATFTRPADTTAYAVSDVVGPAVAAVLSFPDATSANGATGYCVKGKLVTNQAANVAQFRLHLFAVAPTAVADNAQFPTLFADEAKHLGFIDFAACQTEGSTSDAAFALSQGALSVTSDVASRVIYGVLVTKTAWTPASGQQFAIRLSIDQN